MTSKLFTKIDGSDPRLLSLARAMSRYAVPDQYCRISAKSTCQDPLQNSCARSMCRDFYYKIHGPSARSMSPGPREDPCLPIHASVSIRANPLQDAHLRTYVSASLSAGPLQDPCLTICHDTLQDPRLRIISKIHVSGSSINTRPKFSYPCLSIHVFGSVYKHPYLWALCKIHVSGYITRSVADARCKIHVSGVHICDPARRSMCPGACLSVHICGFTTGWTKIGTALQRER